MSQRWEWWESLFLSCCVSLFLLVFICRTPYVSWVSGSLICSKIQWWQFSMTWIFLKDFKNPKNGSTFWQVSWADGLGRRPGPIGHVRLTPKAWGMSSRGVVEHSGHTSSIQSVEATSFPHGSASPSADISTDPIFDGLRKGGSLLCICFVFCNTRLAKVFNMSWLWWNSSGRALQTKEESNHA